MKIRTGAADLFRNCESENWRLVAVVWLDVESDVERFLQLIVGVGNYMYIYVIYI